MELMEEAAQVAIYTSQLNSLDTTQALLKTFAWVDPPEESTFCSKLPHHKPEQQLGSKVHENEQPAIKISSGEGLNCFCSQ